MKKEQKKEMVKSSVKKVSGDIGKITEKSKEIENSTKKTGVDALRKTSVSGGKLVTALRKAFGGVVYRVLGVSLFANFLAIDYIILSKSTTFRILFAQNTDFYNWASIILSVTSAVLFALAMTMLVYIIANRKKGLKESAPSGVIGTIFGAVASGCPVCGAWLLPIFGIAGSLAVFPFQGLEIKVFAIILLGLSVVQSMNVINGVCDKKNAERRLFIGLAVIVALIAALFVLPTLSSEYKTKFQVSGVKAPTVAQINLEADVDKLYNQVNPEKGFALNTNFGNIGYQMVADGAIDFDKFKAVYDRAGSPLTQEQLQIFTEEGLNKPIVINRENSYFLLNLFWAFGLANENPIMTEGEITKYGEGKVGQFAATGGWSIAAKPLAEFMAKSKLAVLTPEQQELLEKVAGSVYRPCCGNSTAFPDCNHGMALLGVLELMAANGATEAELYEASKYFSAYWFPSQALDVATYFMMKEGIDFAQLDARKFVSKQYFSGRGWSKVKGWLVSNAQTDDGTNGGGQAPAGGGGCGVEAAPAQQRSAAPQGPRPAGGGGCGV